MKDKPISAEYDLREHAWTVTSKFGSLAVKDLPLVVGWGEPSSPILERSRHVAIAIGRKLDGSYTVVYELYTHATGDLRDLARQLINAKDLLKVKVCYVDKQSVEFYEYLRQVDGLTQYTPLGEREDGRIEYAQDPSTWPYFAGWETKCELIGIHESIFLKFNTYQAQVQYLIGSGKVKIGMRCPQLLAAQTSLPPGKWETNPFLRALVSGIAMMEKDVERAGEDSEIVQDSWYGSR